MPPRPYEMEDIRVSPHGGYACPVPGCYVGRTGAGWTSREGMLRNHANKAHMRCTCGWIGLSINHHRKHAIDQDQHIRAEYIMPGKTRGEAMPKDASALRREAAALLAEAERIESLPRDTHSSGTVIKFHHSFGDGSNIYDYAAIKARGRWFITQDGSWISSMGPLTWDELLDFANVGGITRLVHGEIIRP